MHGRGRRHTNESVGHDRATMIDEMPSFQFVHLLSSVPLDDNDTKGSMFYETTTNKKPICRAYKEGGPE